MSESGSIDLTPAEVLRFVSAKAAYEQAEVIYAEPLRQWRSAIATLQEVAASIIKAHGFEANGEAWDIAEDGDAVRLVRRTSDDS